MTATTSNPTPDTFILVGHQLCYPNYFCQMTEDADGLSRPDLMPLEEAQSDLKDLVEYEREQYIEECKEDGTEPESFDEGDCSMWVQAAKLVGKKLVCMSEDGSEEFEFDWTLAVSSI